MSAAVGDLIEVELRRAVPGGSVIAGVPGLPQPRTVFVRHGLPGERGRAVVTASRDTGRVLFADLIDIAEAHPGRTAPPCPAAGPGGCGGCDYQHAELGLQRQMKADLLADSLRRIGGMDPNRLPWDGVVHPVPGDEAGLRWRTRGRFAVLDGGLAMHRHRSAELVPIADCPISRSEIVAAARTAAVGAAGAVVSVASSTGQVVAGAAPRLRREVVVEEVDGLSLEVGATGFWQVHPGAPQRLAEVVAESLRPGPSDVLLDLYGGVGLFALLVGRHAGQVHLVEGDRSAHAFARRNLAGLAGARAHRSAVADWLARYTGRADLVVLDPPRAGAGAAVLRHLHRLRPRRVAYVACDPAALSRDLRTAGGLGWRTEQLVALDIFPMTHHLECVATLVPPPA